MPFLVATPTAATATTAGLTALGILGGSKMSSNANNKATQAQAAATDKTLEFQKEQAAQERAYRDKQDAAAKAQFDAQQARFAPYWGASLATLGQYNDRVGIPNMSSAGDLPQSRAAQSEQAPSSSSLYALANPGMGQGMAPKSDYDVSLDSLGAAPIAPAKVTLADIARRYRSA